MINISKFIRLKVNVGFERLVTYENLCAGMGNFFGAIMWDSNLKQSFNKWYLFLRSEQKALILLKNGDTLLNNNKSVG